MNSQVEASRSHGPSPLPRVVRRSAVAFSSRPGSPPERLAGAQRAHSGRIDRPISAFSMWIVIA